MHILHFECTDNTHYNCIVLIKNNNINAALHAIAQHVNIPTHEAREKFVYVGEITKSITTSNSAHIIII